MNERSQRTERDRLQVSEKEGGVLEEGKADPDTMVHLFSSSCFCGENSSGISLGFPNTRLQSRALASQRPASEMDECITRERERQHMRGREGWGSV